jgi:hypothetical protein
MRILTDAPLRSNREMTSREWEDLLLRQERWLAKRKKRRRVTGSGGLPAFLDGVRSPSRRERSAVAPDIH